MDKFDCNILIVDDNEDNRYTIGRKMALTGYKSLFYAEDGEQALALLKQEPFDLVLLDIAMPKMDGIQVLTLMKQDERLQDIQVIVISASNENQNVIKCIELGAEDYLQKPFNPVLLRARVNACLDKRVLHRKEIEYLNRLHESEKIAELGHITVGVAHEMNTPIGVCVSAASYMQEQTCELERAFLQGKITQNSFKSYIADCKSSLSLLEQNLRQAAQLINCFKGIAVDEYRESVQAIDLRSLINEIVEAYKARFEAASVTFVLDCPETVKIHSFPLTIQQILSHLFDNSLLHGFSGKSAGHIKIQLLPDHECLSLIYMDDGHGIPENLRATLFSPFVMGKRNSGHSGLGLSIVYNLIVQIMKGQIIFCNTAPTQGVRFEIKIPLLNLNAS